MSIGRALVEHTGKHKRSDSATHNAIALRVSADGVNWGPRVLVIKNTAAHDATMRVLYPTVLDAATWSRHTTGRNLKLIYGLEANASGAKAPHRAYIADVQLSKAGQAKTVGYDRVKLVRWYKPAGPVDHWCTTKPAPGYQSEGGLGKLATNAIPGTKPLYDCLHSGKNHMVSGASSCEGGVSLGVMGYGWNTPGPGRHALYRCWMSSPEGGVNHFISTSATCEGQKSEGIIAYAE